ncbi:unnamed protein product, partial [Rotaria sordida]
GDECVLVKWVYRIRLHIIGRNLSIEQTIGEINHMFLRQQASLSAG